jgi:hypothetical protein
MAYQGNQRSSGPVANNSRPAYQGKPAVAGSTSASTALLSTGLFAPDREGSKAEATVRTKEAITIPAGSYINLYKADKVVEGKPTYKLQIRESKKQA